MVMKNSDTIQRGITIQQFNSEELSKSSSMTLITIFWREVSLNELNIHIH
jgi:hypothetical protein